MNLFEQVKILLAFNKAMKKEKKEGKMKGALQSMTVWGALIGLLNWGLPLAGVHVAPEQIEKGVEIAVSIISGIMVIVGRFRAQGPLGGILSGK